VDYEINLVKKPLGLKALHLDHMDRLHARLFKVVRARAEIMMKISSKNSVYRTQGWSDELIAGLSEGWHTASVVNRGILDVVFAISRL
jgi:hypothetical protein